MCVCVYVCGSGGHALDMVWTSFLFIRGIWRAPGLVCVCVCTFTAGPRRPSVPHVSHQEPQQLGVILVTVAHTVLIALPLVLLHHLDKHDKSFITGVSMHAPQTYPLMSLI